MGKIKVFKTMWKKHMYCDVNDGSDLTMLKTKQRPITTVQENELMLK
jgi:hypothetical protein